MSTPILNYQEQLRAFHDTKRFEDALRLILEEERKRPGAVDVLSAKAVFLGKLGRAEEAMKAADEVLAMTSSDPEIHNTRGVALYSLERYEEAIKSFDECLSLRPNHPVAAQKKISTLTLLGRYAEAVKSFEQSDLPDLAEEIWLNNLGLMYLEVGNLPRAKALLHRALVTNPFISAIHYNLARVHRHKYHPFRYLLHRLGFLLLSTLEKIPAWQSWMTKRSRAHITESRFFFGSGTLFSSIAQTRETRSILKLLRDINATALCNESWQWFAINIPYDVVEKNGFRGDIDIILKRPRHIAKYDAGFTYRGFQVKTIPVDKRGNIKSAKRGPSNLREIKNQLTVQKRFGCEQVFLLELYVLERGYSTYNKFPSANIRKEIVKKAKSLDKLGYGYVVMAEEPSITHDENSGGIFHMPINVLQTTSNPIGAHFQKLVDGIDAFLAKPTTREMLQSLSQHDPFGTKIGYCRLCRELTMLVPVGAASHICGRCKAPAY